MSKFISKNDFRSRFGLKNREVTISTGDVFQVRALNMEQKRQIREDNLKLDLAVGKKGAADNSATLDIEGMMVDTIVAACISPSFEDSDKDWLLNGTDSAFIQELYEAIETPVKLAALDEEALGN